MNLLCLPLSSGFLSLITRAVLVHSYSFPFLEYVLGNAPALPGLCRAHRSLDPLSFNFLLQETLGKCTYICEETLSSSGLLGACGQRVLRVRFCRPPSSMPGPLLGVPRHHDEHVLPTPMSSSPIQAQSCPLGTNCKGYMFLES